MHYNSFLKVVRAIFASSRYFFFSFEFQQGHYWWWVLHLLLLVIYNHVKRQDILSGNTQHKRHLPKKLDLWQLIIEFLQTVAANVYCKSIAKTTSAPQLPLPAGENTGWPSKFWIDSEQKKLNVENVLQLKLRKSRIPLNNRSKK